MPRYSRCFAGAVVFTLLLAGAAHSQSASVPSQYQSLYTELQTDMQNFEVNLPASTVKGSTAFTGELLTVNGNLGLQLLNPGVRTSYMAELAALKSLGLTAVLVNTGFPTLFQPFYQFNGDPQDYASMLSFYQQVVVDVHAAGLKVVVETQALFPGYYTANAGYGTMTTFFNSLTLQQFEQDCATQIVTIYNQVHPDYINIGSEPDTDAYNSGFSALNDPATWAGYVSLVVSMIPSPHTAPLGAGVGNWQVKQGAAFVAAEASITGLDYIDLHAYPVVDEGGVNTLTNLLNLVDLAESMGKPVGFSEYWLLKIGASQIASNNAQDPTTASLNAYSFWAPLDSEFISDMYRLANWKHLLFTSAFWSNYFWAYIPYSPSDPAPGPPLEGAANQASAAAVGNKQRTETGLTMQSLLLNGIMPPAVASSATFTSSVAVGSLASIFGTNLSTQTAPATGSVTTSLGGVTVSVTDSAGTTLAAGLLYVSPTQINFVIPSGLATGNALVTVTAGSVSQTAAATLTVTAPGLFSESGTGAGVAAAETLTVANGAADYSFVYSCTGGPCQPAPIDVSGGQTYLVLYGTGISGLGQGAVSITVGGAPLPVEFAGGLSDFAGLDQVNVLLPASLAGIGLVPVVVSVNGTASNAVQIQIQ